MTAKLPCGLEGDTCHLPHQGTMDGVALHGRRRTPLCGPCLNARHRHALDLFAQYGIDCEPPPEPAQRSADRQRFVEDYLWLIWAGESHPEAIAPRLGTTPSALARRLYRIGILPLHDTSSHRPAVAA